MVADNGGFAFYKTQSNESKMNISWHLIRMLKNRTNWKLVVTKNISLFDQVFSFVFTVFKGQYNIFVYNVEFKGEERYWSMFFWICSWNWMAGQ